MRRWRTWDGAAHAPDAPIATAWAAGREVDGPLPARSLGIWEPGVLGRSEPGPQVFRIPARRPPAPTPKRRISSGRPGRGRRPARAPKAGPGAAVGG